MPDAMELTRFEQEAWEQCREHYIGALVRFAYAFEDWTHEELAIAVYAHFLIVFAAEVRKNGSVGEKQLRRAQRTIPQQCRRWIRRELGVEVI